MILEFQRNHITGHTHPRSITTHWESHNHTVTMTTQELQRLEGISHAQMGRQVGKMSEIFLVTPNVVTEKQLIRLWTYLNIQIILIKSNSTN